MWDVKTKLQDKGIFIKDEEIISMVNLNLSMRVSWKLKWIVALSTMFQFQFIPGNYSSSSLLVQDNHYYHSLSSVRTTDWRGSIKSWMVW